jgi:hypothetical protein
MQHARKNSREHALPVRLAATGLCCAQRLSRSFAIEVALVVPSPDQRLAMFVSGLKSAVLTGMLPAVSVVADGEVTDMDIVHGVAAAVSRHCHAYLAGDIVHVISTAARTLSTTSSPISASDAHHGTTSSLQHTLMAVVASYRPALLRGVTSGVVVASPAAVDWSDIVGLSDACKQLQEMIVLPRTRPEVCVCAKVDNACASACAMRV